jgi:hypothetical protein
MEKVWTLFFVFSRSLTIVNMSIVVQFYCQISGHPRHHQTGYDSRTELHYTEGQGMVKGKQPPIPSESSQQDHTDSGPCSSQIFHRASTVGRHVHSTVRHGHSTARHGHSTDTAENVEAPTWVPGSCPDHGSLAYPNSKAIIIKEETGLLYQCTSLDKVPFNESAGPQRALCARGGSHVSVSAGGWNGIT